MALRDVHVLDLQFQGVAQVIAAFLVEGDAGLMLVESGPYSTYLELQHAVRAAGFAIAQIEHVLVTHVHFDHAGAAWALAKEAKAKVHVHPLGLKHLADPARLWRSAARIYGDEGMDTLWGRMERIPMAQLKSWEDKETEQLLGITVTAIHTPGHAKHHITWQVGNHLFLGDVGGVKIGAGPVEPPCPPPDINPKAWQQSITQLLPLVAHKRCYLTHFGSVMQPVAHLNTLAETLSRWVAKAAELYDANPEAGEDGFVTYVEAQRVRNAEVYRLANPAFMSWPGLLRALTTDTTQGKQGTPSRNESNTTAKGPRSST